MKTYEDLANRIAQLERRILGAPRETQPQRQAGLVAQLTACKARLDALMRGSEGEAFFKTYGTRAWALQAEEEGPCMALDEKYHRLTAVMPELQEVGGHLTTLAGLTSRDTATNALAALWNGDRRNVWDDMASQREALFKAWRQHQGQTDAAENVLRQGADLLTSYHTSVVMASDVFLAFEETLNQVERHFAQTNTTHDDACS